MNKRKDFKKKIREFVAKKTALIIFPYLYKKDTIHDLVM